MVLGLLTVIWFIGVPLCLWQALATAFTGDAELDRGGTNAWLAAAAVIYHRLCRPATAPSTAAETVTVQVDERRLR